MGPYLEIGPLRYNQVKDRELEIILDLERALNLITGVLIKESKDIFRTQRYKGEGHGKTDAHRGRPYQDGNRDWSCTAKILECQGLPAATRSWKRHGTGFLPQSLQKESVLLTP